MDTRKIKSKQGLFRLIELAGEKKGLLIWAALFSSLSVLLSLLPYVSVYYVLSGLLRQAAVAAPPDGAQLIRYAMLGLGGLVLGLLAMYIGGMCSHIAAFRILYGIRMRLAEHIAQLPLGYFSRNSAGKIKKVVERDVEKIEKFIAHQLPDLINSAVMLVVIAVSMFALNPWMALAGLLPMIIGLFAQYRMMSGSQGQENLRAYFDAMENINTSSIQYVRGMPSIKVFGQTVRSFRKFYSDMENYRDFSLNYTDRFQHGYVTYRVLLLSLASFVFPIGVLLLSQEPQNIALAAVLIFFLVLSPGAAVPMFRLSSLASTLGVISEAARRVDEMLDEPTIPEVEKPKRPVTHSLAFRQVGFSYDSGSTRVQALQHVEFVAREGEVTALVGPSGSGKSTIAQLIPRFWDVDEGSISIGGVDVREMELKTLMDTVSFVFQDNFLFFDTVYANIAAGNPSASREAVYAAAEAAQCKEFIDRMPNGYETRIGEGGVYLSGGEEQRLSVARALLKNAPILVLDEATAYADPENEYKMQLALRELIRGKTVIMIAHRLSTIRHAQNIVVMNGGSVEETGQHEELLRVRGLYSRLWQAYSDSSGWQIETKERIRS